MVPVCLGAADAVVVAGGARFAAHAALLAAHSGYFRAALQHAQQRAPHAPLYVPDVAAHHFWPLLAYMYTGYLDLSADNIYHVLLATHLLHMPRALELCRSFLAGGRPSQPATTPTLVKPIPSRKLPAFGPTPHALFAPLRVDASTPLLRSSVCDVAPRRDATSPPGRATPLPLPLRERVDTQREDDDESELDVCEDSRCEPRATSKRDPKPTPSESGDSKSSQTKADDKVIVDVACCDGPVRFHRVLNGAYGGSKGDNEDKIAELTDSDDSYVEIEEDTNSKDARPSRARAFEAFYAEQMKRNDPKASFESNENRPASCDGSADAETSSSKRQDAVYTCVYCNHTFKSQYCYQKHARRHLNPVSIDAVNGELSEEFRKSKKTTKVPTTSLGPRREVKLLDMNVQYYPCKTCGSKFPSYYFVHKHRKMCHAEELEGTLENVKSQNDDKRPKTSCVPGKEHKISEDSRS